jgi:hypothetical protein
MHGARLGTRVLLALSALWVGMVAIYSPPPTAYGNAERLKQPQASQRLPHKVLLAACAYQRSAKLAEYQALFAYRLFDAAWLMVKECADATGDAELHKLADTARVSHLKNRAYDIGNLITVRTWALDRLKREFPKEFDTGARLLFETLLGRIALEISAIKCSSCDVGVWTVGAESWT